MPLKSDPKRGVAPLRPRMVEIVTLFVAGFLGNQVPQKDRMMFQDYSHDGI